VRLVREEANMTLDDLVVPDTAASAAAVFLQAGSLG
jgi:hypothetical protein